MNVHLRVYRKDGSDKPFYEATRSKELFRPKPIDLHEGCDGMAAAWHSRMSGQPPLSALPKAERERTLVAIVQHALKLFYP